MSNKKVILARRVTWGTYQLHFSDDIASWQGGHAMLVEKCEEGYDILFADDWEIEQDRDGRVTWKLGTCHKLWRAGAPWEKVPLPDEWDEVMGEGWLHGTGWHRSWRREQQEKDCREWEAAEKRDREEKEQLEREQREERERMNRYLEEERRSAPLRAAHEKYQSAMQTAGRRYEAAQQAAAAAFSSATGSSTRLERRILRRTLPPGHPACVAQRDALATAEQEYQKEVQAAEEQYRADRDKAVAAMEATAHTVAGVSR